MFKDIENHWAREAIEWIVRKGLLRGKPGPNGELIFDPDAPLTRAEFAVVEWRKEYDKNVLRKSGNAIIQIVNPKGGIGSGSIIRKDGLILTCHHVIDGNENGEYEINFNPEIGIYRKYARVVAFNDFKDLALLQITDTSIEYPVVKLSPEKPIKGQEVYAVGSPLNLRDTWTRGVVSHEERWVPYYNQFVPVKLIQTDAAINPGNSGGALLDAEGELIGVPSVKIVGEGLEGLNFAIHIDEVREFLGRNGITL